MIQHQGVTYKGTLSFVFFNGWRSRQLDNRLFGAYRDNDPIHDWLARCDVGLGKDIAAFTSYAQIGDDLFLYDTSLIIFAELLDRRRRAEDETFFSITRTPIVPNMPFMRVDFTVRNDKLDTLIPIVKRYIRRFGLLHQL